MSESGQQRNESPLLSDRGTTIISDTVVSSLAGMAAQEVEGVHMGGGASRTAGGVLESLTGSESKTSGISVEVGRTETAIELNATITDITFPEKEARRRIGSGRSTREDGTETTAADTTDTTTTESEPEV